MIDGKWTLETMCSPYSLIRTISGEFWPSEPGAPCGQRRIGSGSASARCASNDRSKNASSVPGRVLLAREIESCIECNFLSPARSTFERSDRIRSRPAAHCVAHRSTRARSEARSRPVPTRKPLGRGYSGSPSRRDSPHPETRAGPRASPGKGAGLSLYSVGVQL